MITAALSGQPSGDPAAAAPNLLSQALRQGSEALDVGAKLQFALRRQDHAPDYQPMQPAGLLLPPLP